MKTAKEYLDEANREVPRVPVEEAMTRHAGGGALFIDVRDSAAIAKTGTIAGAARVPRGFLEFAADESGQYHNPVLRKDAEIYLVCGAGGQAALAGKTLKEMGFGKVHNIGGIGDWKAAGGPMED
ncbi:rhodanese-like domain-containing protein [Rubellimicrobium aerolatum]|uniref:Rhodanese-like domain-containing protein n=1 Tax=Rubellimicrobium aerolatum TaxID=490979 RepID=A0ABW0SAU7_9RHOB|nr:rhodanese-like domain-containing protein [Rubellimicrobium aerolatum]MBP1806115.1 rhodanese-related sulfurtransferase [Rubellimicrobium aerolatum]